LPNMKPGTLLCHGGDFNNAPIVDVRGQGGGGPEGGSVNTRGSGPAAAKGEGAPAADSDLKTKADLGAEVKKIKAQAASNPTAVQSLPGPMRDTLRACCRRDDGSWCEGLNHCR
jgi:hypothetical protein